MVNKNIQRNTAIDILKFIAVFLVMNSHMEVCYPKYQFLSTGGAIGDALFFFASGFTLFLGRDMRFDQWYKRRINRIYPSIIAVSIIAYVFWSFEENIGDILMGKRYWFIGCIMVYYIFLYPIKKIKKEKFIKWIFIGWLIIVIAVFFVIWKGNEAIYSKGLFRCLLFFLFMLQGAIMGKHAELFTNKLWHLPAFIISVITWFYLVHAGSGNALIILSVIPLLFLTYCLYCICNSIFFSKVYNSRIGRFFICVISQLCLEVYLIQKFIFTDAFNHIFPWNVPIIMLMVIMFSYFVKLLAEFISQTFKNEPYDWKKFLLLK